MKILLAIALVMCPIPMFAQTEDAEVTLALAAARAECAEYQGDFSIDPLGITRMDITGDGVAETFVDERLAACSSLAAFRTGTGGWILNVVKGDVLLSVQTLDWGVLDWQPRADDPAQKVLLLSVHGSMCGMAGSSPCVQAVVWSADVAQFVSTAAME